MGNLIGYGGNFTSLTKKFKEENEKEYDIKLLYVLIDVAVNQNMKASTIKNPTRNGTHISFNLFKSQKDVDKYEKKLYQMADIIKMKYGEEIIKNKE